MVVLHLAIGTWHERPALAQAPVVAEIRLEQEGRVVSDPAVLDLVETPVGQPLDMRQVRETITHLNSLRRYDDIQVFQEPAGTGVRLRYVLVPAHPVDRVEFRGDLGVSRNDLRRAVRERFGATPAADRAQDVAAMLDDTYAGRGYPAARVVPRVEETHDPDRATLVFDIQAGPRVSIARVIVDQADPASGVIEAAPDVRAGQPYDTARIQRALERYADSMRDRGFLEARASHRVEFLSDGAHVTLSVNRGPRVTIAFAGAPVPEGERERLVPVREAGSVDEDLLEDAQAAIRDYFRERGYRDADVTYARAAAGSDLTITITTNAGPRYVVERIELRGVTAIPQAELRDVIPLGPGDPFVEATLGVGVSNVLNTYRLRGFTGVALQPRASALPPDNPGDTTRRVDIVLDVVEGPRTLVRRLDIEGNGAVATAALGPFATAAGRPLSEADLGADLDRIELEYRNRGYDAVTVDRLVQLVDDGTQADVTFRVAEGPRILIDHIIIVGNTRTSTRTIERELTLREGQPLGFAQVIESQQRLAALGLFRLVRITDVRTSGDGRRDVLVTVEEADPTTIAYSGGAELGSRLRSGDQGAEERYELVPRGSFEIGRRNLWGKNRSVNLFTRAALRSRDRVIAADPAGVPQTEADDGFNEYRLLGTFREPRIFGSRADLLVTGIIDQAIRSSFNFTRRETRAELGLRVNPQYSLVGRYSFQRTELFDDENIPEADKPVIDRVFPQVRLSKFSTSFIRDTRSDLLDPVDGTFLILDGEVAARGFGSQVGFVKTYLQGFAYRQLPVQRRLVLAVGGRLGAARGFDREIVDGEERVLDLPASERFFAGGSTTVRGFSLDRLGNADTITPSGFPTGGNAVVIVNAELRAGITGSIDGVVFADAGNIFSRAASLDLTDLRPAFGVGGRYRSPLGPIRVDVGFNPDRRILAADRRERAAVLHISLGQAF